MVVFLLRSHVMEKEGHRALGGPTDEDARPSGEGSPPKGLLPNSITLRVRISAYALAPSGDTNIQCVAFSDHLLWARPRASSHE